VSGVSWKDTLPEGWEATPLKRVVQPTRPITYGIVQCGPDVEGGVPYIRPVDMHDERGLATALLQRTAPEIAVAYERSRIAPGDLVVSIGPSFGKVMIVPRELDGANLTQGTARVAPSALVDGRYLFWVLRSREVRDEWDAECSGATFRALTLEILREGSIPLPPREVQREVASFLDRETARIDTLIETKRRLLDLLEEKRTALITRAVTRGLDPDVPMKDSGVEWIGEIPTHWGVSKVKHVTRLESGHTPSRSVPDYWVDCTIPWITLADVGQIRDGKTEYIYETKEAISERGLANSAARRLPEGTVILSRTASVGFSGVMSREMATSQDFANWVPQGMLLPEFLLYVFRAMHQEFRRMTMGSTHQTIYMPDIRKLRTPVPPLEEQTRIVSHIRAAVEKSSELASLARGALALLDEYRSALISAAVTGSLGDAVAAPPSMGTRDDKRNHT
jgi:type I restriction enzyme, S subunit